MEPVAWGVMGTARIALNKVVPAMQRSPWVRVHGIASRSAATAQAAADRLGISRAYGSYQALLEDPAIEAVYIPVPNHLHVPMSLAAAAAGKHVLCEKPLALDAAEASALKEPARNVLIAEAFMVRHHPQWVRLRELLREGRIGTPRLVQASFSFYNDDPADIRNQPELGGGALYDIGCYTILAGRFVFETEPRRVVALVDQDARLGVDRTTSGLLDFGEGRQLAFSVSTQCCSQQRLMVVGTRGRLELEIPYNAPQGVESRLRLDETGALDGSGIRVETLTDGDQYRRMVEDFSRRVRGEQAPFWGLEDALPQMAVIDALFRSARSGAWESVEAFP